LARSACGGARLQTKHHRQYEGKLFLLLHHYIFESTP